MNNIPSKPVKSSKFIVHTGTAPGLGMDDIFSFGKHNGKQVEDVLEDNPEYLVWCIENYVREFDEEVIQKLEKKGLI